MNTPLSPSENPQPTGLPKPCRVHVIANPVGTAVRRLPLLTLINDTFKAHDVAYEVMVMKDSGDALRLARQAVEEGAELVAACGGDGTVMEVAQGLMGTGVPMAILPGGTANVMALTLGIPTDLVEAMTMIITGAGELRAVDMGKVNEHLFLLRAAVGAEAQMTLQTAREAKARWGNLAYVFNGLASFLNPTVAAFTLNLDGMRVEVDGISAMVANSANVGLSGVNVVQDSSVFDGLLDVIVIRGGDLPSLLSVAGSVISSNPQPPEPLLHWKAREVQIITDPPLAAIADGEDIGFAPITASVIPQAVQILCPAPAQETPPAA